MEKSTPYSSELMDVLLSLRRSSICTLSIFCERYGLDEKLFVALLSAKSVQVIRLLPVTLETEIPHSNPPQKE